MAGSALKLLLVVNAAWCAMGEAHHKKIHSKHMIPLSDRHSQITNPITDVSLKFRDRLGAIVLDDDARLLVSDHTKEVFLRSDELAVDLENRDRTDLLVFLHFEQAQDVLRLTVHFSTLEDLEALGREQPELRLFAYDLPPSTVVELGPTLSKSSLDSEGIYEVLLARIQLEDPALFAIHSERFLRAPHIVVPLLSHLASLSAEDNLKFPVQLKRLSDQLRAILARDESPLKICKIETNHLNTWAEAQGKRFAFVDGGVARIAGLPGTEPTALRVGIYSVCAGDVHLESREKWELQPFVVGDIIDKNTGVSMDDDDQIDLRRLGEAARYTLEPLAALRFINQNPGVDSVFVHGPLINQFVQYDEGEPNFIPYLKEEFLAHVGIAQADVEHVVKDIPKGSDGKRMWRQFMALYGYISARVSDANIPFVGVVERSAGTWLAEAVLANAVDANIVLLPYKKKVMTLLKRYSISDDFLFGCVLAEGEYLSPTSIAKNLPRRAREHWQSVVGRYPRPFATVLKTTEVSFPFRVEMNGAGKVQERKVMELLYHTARLLPRYAFPVGLDIVDKYAKVPDWLSRNISARIASVVLNRAMAEGDARLIAQIRQLLAHTPRDFFYRPQP